MWDRPLRDGTPQIYINADLIAETVLYNLYYKIDVSDESYVHCVDTAVPWENRIL